MALSSTPITSEDLENARRQRQHRRIFFLMLIVDVLLAALVIFDVLRLLNIIHIG